MLAVKCLLLPKVSNFHRGETREIPKCEEADVLGCSFASTSRESDGWMDGLTRRAKRSHLAVASLACRAAAVERAPLFFVIVTGLFA